MEYSGIMLCADHIELLAGRLSKEENFFLPGVIHFLVGNSLYTHIINIGGSI